jgi:hypothetical protein
MAKARKGHPKPKSKKSIKKTNSRNAENYRILQKYKNND